MLARRHLLLSLLAGLLPWRSRATPEQMRLAMQALFGEREIKSGRVHLDIPPLVENGNAVPLTVRLDGPSEAGARITTLHIFNEKNPQPHVITVSFGPMAARTGFSTRIKLADSQVITAIAEAEDGTLWRGEAATVVTVAACIEQGP